MRGSIKGVKDKFTNEDLERTVQLKRLLEDKLADCEKDVQGDKAEKPEMTNEKLLSMQARKKIIIGSINKMVNQFNENNKYIKEVNKMPKTERDMSDLIKRNREIQDDCIAIEMRIAHGREFALEIHVRLDSILDPALAEIREKYNYKNELLDECDELYDGAE